MRKIRLLVLMVAFIFAAPIFTSCDATEQEPDQLETKTNPATGGGEDDDDEDDGNG